ALVRRERSDARRRTLHRERHLAEAEDEIGADHSKVLVRVVLPVAVLAVAFAFLTAFARAVAAFAVTFVVAAFAFAAFVRACRRAAHERRCEYRNRDEVLAAESSDHLRVSLGP